MATFRWRGNGAGTKSAWNDGRNWVDESGAAYLETRWPGSLTANTDHVYFDAALSSGALSVAGFDTDSGAGTVGRVVCGPEYNGTIGTDAAFLDIAAATLTCNSGTSGAFYIEKSTSDVFCYDAARLILQGGTRLFAFRGNIELRGTTPAITSAYITSSENDVRLTIATGATFGGITMYGGQVINNAPIAGAVTMTAGTFRHQGGDIGAVALNLIGGTFDWRNGDIDASAVLNVIGGKLDASKSSEARYAMMTSINLYPGGTIDLDNGIGTVGIPLGVIQNFGGQIKTSPGSRIEVVFY